MNEQTNGTREKLDECLKLRTNDGFTRVTEDFGGADLSRWSCQRQDGAVDFAGNFAGAKFVDTILPPTNSDFTRLYPIYGAGRLASA